jgi:farnesyl-diphosphate farnesyltransferase
VEAANIHLTANSATQASVEAWSGKDRNAENFPVGSWLISPRLRPHVHAFYAFARNADDIADNASLTEAEKISRLGVMEDVLQGRRTEGSPTATALRASLAATSVTPDHARDLLHAFRQDATKSRYATWAELIDYCRYSAMPVGRYMLDLHGEARDTWPHSDALCATLQVLNHLQDCADDYATLNRCYLPTDALTAAGASIEDLRGPAETPALRVVIAALLDKCIELNTAAAPLPALVRDRRLRMECAVIVRLAQRLTVRLRRQDPIAGRVKLTGTDGILGIIAALGAMA